MKTFDQASYYQGIRMVRYDLIKELVWALAGVTALIFVLAGIFSSPDVPSVTIQSWAQQDPIDFVRTAVDELAGQSDSAQYGPPYTAGSNSVQTLGFFAPQVWAGIHLAVDPTSEFVLRPLRYASGSDARVAAALAQYGAAPPSQQQVWLASYRQALDHASIGNGRIVVPSGTYGPLPELVTSLLGIARTGGLDGLLLDTRRFFATDFTRPLLFLGDGTYLAGLADRGHLLGSQWGVMNETGSYPGQAWLWLYTMWYQIPPYNSAANADLLVLLTMMVLTSVLALVPFIPVLRDIPRWLPVHRLIWRRR